jgi:hypothetical protein
MQKISHNVETGEIINLELTDEEIEERKKWQSETQEIVKEAVKVTAAKAALLEKLGITEDEAKLLLS